MRKGAIRKPNILVMPWTIFTGTGTLGRKSISEGGTAGIEDSDEDQRTWSDRPQEIGGVLDERRQAGDVLGLKFEHDD